MGDILVDEAGNRLGAYCSDSCVVSVVLLRDMLGYAPEVLESLPRHCYAVIPDFHGYIERRNDPEGEYWMLCGLGAPSFHTTYED